LIMAAILFLIALAVLPASIVSQTTLIVQQSFNPANSAIPFSYSTPFGSITLTGSGSSQAFAVSPGQYNINSFYNTATIGPKSYNFFPAFDRGTDAESGVDGQGNFDVDGGTTVTVYFNYNAASSYGILIQQSISPSNPDIAANYTYISPPPRLGRPIGTEKVILLTGNEVAGDSIYGHWGIVTPHIDGYSKPTIVCSNDAKSRNFKIPDPNKNAPIFISCTYYYVQCPKDKLSCRRQTAEEEEPIEEE